MFWVVEEGAWRPIIHILFMHVRRTWLSNWNQFMANLRKDVTSPIRFHFPARSRFCHLGQLATQGMLHFVWLRSEWIHFLGFRLMLKSSIPCVSIQSFIRMPLLNFSQLCSVSLHIPLSLLCYWWCDLHILMDGRHHSICWFMKARHTPRVVII